MNISLDEKFFTDLYNLEHNNYIDFKYDALRVYNGVWYRAYKNLLHKFAIDIKPTQDLLNFVFKELDFCESAGYTPYHTPFDYFDYLDFFVVISHLC